MSVICRIRQSRPERILPLSRNDSQGRRMAMRSIIIRFSNLSKRARKIVITGLSAKVGLSDIKILIRRVL